ncbi:hypothetical protein F5Y12DRAFT_709831 [Xylaria sp. FL1777]|nr:hypothetical protein F5Y12DRAFT_709831 [Xylaria sp. FL1777]
MGPFTSKMPLWHTTFYNAVGLACHLCDARVSLQLIKCLGEIPLLSAIAGNAKEAFDLLRDLGANTTHINSRKHALLHYATHFANLETMRTLTDVDVRGQDATARDQDGLTAQQLPEKRQPISEMKAALADLVQVWRNPNGTDDGTTDEGNYFYGSVEYFGRDGTTMRDK